MGIGPASRNHRGSKPPSGGRGAVNGNGREFEEGGKVDEELGGSIRHHVCQLCGGIELKRRNRGTLRFQTSGHCVARCAADHGGELEWSNKPYTGTCRRCSGRYLPYETKPKMNMCLREKCVRNIEMYTAGKMRRDHLWKLRRNASTLRDKLTANAQRNESMPPSQESGGFNSIWHQRWRQFEQLKGALTCIVPSLQSLQCFFRVVFNCILDIHVAQQMLVHIVADIQFLMKKSIGLGSHLWCTSISPNLLSSSKASS